jgi:hypothetical protein
MTNVFFLVRAYNDFDCRLPLMLEFSKDSSYCVNVIVYPTNKGINDINSHNLYKYAQDRGIIIKTIYDFNNFFLLRILSRFYFFISDSESKKSLFFYRFRNYLARIIFGSISLLSKRNTFFKEIFLALKGSIIVIDEIIFSDRRSFFVDELRDYWKRTFNFYLCSFVTGQNIFLNLNNPLYVSSDNLGDELDIPLFVPGPNDQKLWQLKYPKQNIEIVGNTRFDSSWIQTLNGIYNHSFSINECGNKTIKIVFMLSKLEYGVNSEEIINSINACSLMENVIVIVKPHTRGMKLEDLACKINDKVIDGSQYSSSDLINWADFVTFTGSSIVFHAILSNKFVIYLKYCHIFETIFDSIDSKFIANNLNELLLIIKNQKGTINYDRNFISIQIHNKNLSGNICENIKNKIILKSVKYL